MCAFMCLLCLLEFVVCCVYCCPSNVSVFVFMLRWFLGFDGLFMVPTRLRLGFDFVTLRSSDLGFLGILALLRFKPRRGSGEKLRRVVGDGFMGFLVCFLYPIGCG